MLVPVIVLSPHLPDQKDYSHFLGSVVDTSAVRSIVAAGLPSGCDEVVVVAAAHGVADHPSLATAVSAAHRSATRYRRLLGGEDGPRFAVEEHGYVDAGSLHVSFEAAAASGKDNLASALLSEVGHDGGLMATRLMLDDALKGEDIAPIAALASRGTSGETVVPVFVLSDLSTDSFDHGLLFSAGSAGVIVLHSSSADGNMMKSLPDLVSRRRGAHSGSYLGINAADGTSSVAAGVLTALTGVPAPPFGVHPTHEHEHHAAADGNGANNIVDFSWAVGFHAFKPFGLLSSSGGARSEKFGTSTDTPPRYSDHLSPIYTDAASWASLAANLWRFKQALSSLEASALQFEASISRNLTFLGPRRDEESSASCDQSPGLSPLIECRRSLRSTLRLPSKPWSEPFSFSNAFAEQGGLQGHNWEKLAGSLEMDLPGSLTPAPILAASDLVRLSSLALRATATLMYKHPPSSLSELLRAAAKIRHDAEMASIAHKRALNKALSLWASCCELEVDPPDTNEHHAIFVVVGAVVASAAIFGAAAKVMSQTSRDAQRRKRMGTA